MHPLSASSTPDRWSPLRSGFTWVLLITLATQVAVGFFTAVLLDLANGDVYTLGGPHRQAATQLGIAMLAGLLALGERVIPPRPATQAAGAALLVAGAVLQALFAHFFPWGTPLPVFSVVTLLTALLGAGAVVGLALRDRTPLLLLHAALLLIAVVPPLLTDAVLRAPENDIYLHDTTFQVGAVHLATAVGFVLLGAITAVRWRPLASLLPSVLALVAVGLLAIPELQAGAQGFPRSYMGSGTLVWARMGAAPLLAASLVLTLALGLRGPDTGTPALGE